MKHKTQGEHPHHKGAGMPGFRKEHWEKQPGDIMVANDKYSKSEMGNPEELKESVDKLSSYVKKNREKY